MSSFGGDALELQDIDAMSDPHSDPSLTPEEGDDLILGAKPTVAWKNRVTSILVAVLLIGVVITIVALIVNDSPAPDGTAEGTESPAPENERSFEVRLVGGAAEYEGRIEVKRNGSWGSVCSNSWTLAQAHVVCRSLGFYGALQAPINAFFGQGQNEVWLDEVSCQGTEAELVNCDLGWNKGRCLHSQDASAVCAKEAPECRVCPVLPVLFTPETITIVVLCELTKDATISFAANSSGFQTDGDTIRPGERFTFPVPSPFIQMKVEDSSRFISESLSIADQPTHHCGVSFPPEVQSGVYAGSTAGVDIEIAELLQNRANWDTSYSLPFPDSSVKEFVVYPSVADLTPTSAPSTLSPPVDFSSPVPPTRVPTPVPTPIPTPKPIFCPGGVDAEGSYLAQYALGQTETFNKEDAWKKCLQLNWACGGITCDSAGCSLRKGTNPQLSPNNEHSCVSNTSYIEDPASCISWMQYKSCDSEELLWNAELSCAEKIPKSANGFCLCGGKKIRKVSCSSDFGEDITCNDICDDQQGICALRNPCGEFQCIQRGESNFGTALCKCPPGLIGEGFNEPPSSCRSTFVSVEPGLGCPDDLFPLYSEEMCLSGIESMNLSTIRSDESDALPGGGCQYADGKMLWTPPLPIATNAEAPQRSHSPTKFTLCTSNEQVGGFIPPSDDYIPTDMTQEDAVKGLLQRILGNASTTFVVRVKRAGFGDTCTLQTSGAVVTVSGTSAVAAARCVYTYLKQNGISVAWGRNHTGYNIALPEEWLQTSFTLTSRVPYKYAYNTCTFSYTMVWWSWERWEQEIDWLALRGVNLPLAFVGQEYFWWRVYSSLGLSEEEILDHFTGPAFFAWERMGNLETWHGPLTRDFVDARLALQLKILARMQSFGMSPVLPTFAGHVPKALRKYFGASYIESEAWNGFPSTLLLQPTDPLFQRIAAMFIEEQKKAYNWTSHFYNGDTFNEMNPSSSDTEYLKSSAKGVIDGIKAGDPHGKWIVQGWLFMDGWWNDMNTANYLAGMNKSEVIVLDLTAEMYPFHGSTHEFSDHAYVWCILHNYGGRPGTYGNLAMTQELALSSWESIDSTMVGMGITMEATQQNPIVYDMVLDLAWEGTAAENYSDWTSTWIQSRYSIDKSSPAYEAWLVFLRTLYQGDRNPGAEMWMMYSRPKMYSECGCSEDTLRSDNEVHQAWSKFIDSELVESELWNRDAAVFTTFVMQTAFCRTLKAVFSSISSKADLSVVSPQLRRLEGIISDLDAVLATDTNTQLACWLSDAAEWGNATTRSRWRQGAIRQLTTWSSDARFLDDYAKKAWSGLVGGYYLKRWQLFSSVIETALQEGKYIQMDSSQISFESEWLQNYDYSDAAAEECSRHGNILDLARGIRMKYYPHLVST
ncbi:Alpha-N-acetylglucosaminidase [Diplonema papillatum]|nr:Alpha-N-acetylglucosaminidase [Diplonema papillatum]